LKGGEMWKAGLRKISLLDEQKRRKKERYGKKRERVKDLYI
jgi:hypothetical protein